MESEQELWTKIRQNYRNIVKDQDALSMLDFLYEKFIFNQEECDQVRAKETPQDKNRKLLDLLEKKPHACHQSYVEGLDACSHSHLADSIRKTKPLPQVEESDTSSFTSNVKTVRERNRQYSKQHLNETLRNLICIGDTEYRCDIYPYLVCNAPDPHISVECLAKDFEFLRSIPWKAIFEFEYDGNIKENSLYKFMDETLEMVMTVSHVDEFDEQNQSGNNLEDKIKHSKETVWFSVNGDSALQKDVLTLKDWKRNYSQGFKEALRFVSRQTPQGRAVVVFLLLSQNYQIMLAAAEDICLKFPDNWLVLAESEQICKEWKEEMLKREIVDQQVLDSQCVTGMPWSHVNETIQQIFGNDKAVMCQLPSSTGTPITLPNKVKRFLVDLEILGCNECLNSELVTDQQRKYDLERVKNESEQKFYRGSQVDWWNFFFKNQVLERDMFKNLRDRVLKLLGEDVWDEDQHVGRINLYHQPAAGGTTVAKHILWELRDKYRCVNVKHITDDTSNQLFTLRSHGDPNPRPVLFLLDNFGDEQISDLLEKMVNEARMLDMGRLNTFAFVAIISSRKAAVKRTSDENTFLLESKLSTAELSWLNDKYKLLEHNHKHFKAMDPRNFISFNILKENFNQDYIKKSVEELTSEITLPQERNLLMYISLINRFDLLVHPLPVASFDCIMGKAKWEISISKPLRVLLNETLERGFGAIGAFRIINNSLSKYIFETLCNQDGKKRLEGHVMLEFLDTSIFKSTESVVEELLKVIRFLMKNRERKHTTGIYRTQFAPLVQAIVDDTMQSVPLAADVLQRVYELSLDPFVAQQIARLYIFSRNWVKATEYGEIITQNYANNSFLWDTFAQVFKGQLLEKYHECIAKKGTNCALVPARDAPSVLNIGLRAIDVFRTEQEVSETERSYTTNNAGYFGEIETVARMLDYMTSVDGLQEIADLRRFLVDDTFIPKTIHICWDKSLIDRVKTLLVSVVQACKRLDDERLQVKRDYKDGNAKMISRHHEDNLLKHRECIDGYMCEGVQEVPPSYSKSQASGFYRRQIIALRGNTLRGLFDIRRSENAAKKLKMILNCAEKNIGTEFELLTDLQVYLGTSIALCTLGCTEEFTLDRLVQLSTDLYEGCDKHKETELEPYMFAFMFNWPRDDLPDRPVSLAAHRLPELLQNWNKAFNRKYPKNREPGRRETTLFFLANGDGTNRYLYEGQLPRRTGYRNVEFWNSVSDRLERLSGVLLSQGNAVKLTMEQDGNKSAIEIKAAYPEKNVMRHNKMVSFYLGISWSGPKAYYITSDGLQNKSSAATGYSSDCSTSVKWKPVTTQQFISQTRQSSFHSSAIPSSSRPQLFALEIQDLERRKDSIMQKLLQLRGGKTAANKQKEHLKQELKSIEDKMKHKIRQQLQDTDVFKYESVL